MGVFFEDIKLVSELITNDNSGSLKRDLRAKYDLFCQAMNDATQSKIIKSNLSEYSAICNLQVMEFALASASISDLANYTSLYPEWSKLAGDKNTEKVNNLHKIFVAYLKKLSPSILIGTNKIIRDRETRTTTIRKFTIDDLNSALQTFGAEVVTPESMVNTEDIDEIPPEQFNFDDVFGDPEEEFGDPEFEDFDDLDDDDNADTDTDETDDEAFAEFEDFDDDTDNNTDTEDTEEIEDADENEQEDIEELDNEQDQDEADNDSESSNLDEQIEKFKKSSFAGNINNRVGRLVATFMSLYESGFTGIPQEGLLFLTDDEASASGSPVLKLNKENKATIGSRDDTDNFDLRFVYNSLKSSIKDFGSVIYSEAGERVPSTEMLLSQNGICFELHLSLQSRSIDFVKGLISVRKFITKQCGSGSVESHNAWLDRENSGNHSRLSVIDVIEKWYKWAIERIFYKVLIDKFKTVEGMNGNDVEVVNTLKNVESKLRNVIVLDSKDKGAVFSVKMSHNTISSIGLDGIKAMADNIANMIDGSKTRVTAERAIANGVATIEVVVNAEKANSANLFAADVVDGLLEAGIRPSWSNCMLGKSDEGGVIFWNKFRNPDENTVEKRCYSIFAGSRSGKGVMTSTLIASAVSEGVDVFYTDGKPENGPCLGLMAWEQGLDAYVFDGKESGSAPFSGLMEDYTHGVRQATLISDKFSQLPSMFGNNKYFGESKFKKFAGLMRYLKSLYLMCKIITARADGVISKSNWQLWVFDEMTSMCKVEADIRDIFVKYLADKGISTNRHDLTGGKVSAKVSKAKLLDEGDSYDENVAYIDQFKRMMDTMESLVVDAVTITIGKADMNLIMIFQNANWLADSAYSGCMIQNLVSATGKSTTKIVGKGALSNGAGEYGDYSTVHADWYTKYVNTKAKWWAISDEADLRSNKVSLFKPYQIWTIPNHMKTKYATVEDVERLKREDPDSDVKVGDEIAENGTLLTESEIMAEEASHPGYYKKFFAGYMKTLEQKFEFSTASILNNAFNYATDAMTTLGLNLDGYSSVTDFIYDYANLIPESKNLTQEDLEASLGNSDATTQRQSGSGSSINLDKVNEDAEYNIPEMPEAQYNDNDNTASTDNSVSIDKEPHAQYGNSEESYMQPADPADDEGIYTVFERRLKDANFRPNGLPSIAKLVNSGALLRVTFDENWDARQKQMYMDKFKLVEKVEGCNFNAQERVAFRDANKKPSLRYQTIIIGCLWVVTHNGGDQDVWNKVKIGVFNMAQQYAGDANSADKFARAAITHCIMDDIDTSVLPLTEPNDRSTGIPTEEMLSGYIKKSASGQTQANPMPYTSPDAMSQEFYGDNKPDEFEYSDIYNNDVGVQSWENQPEQVQPVETSCYSGFGGGMSQLNPRPTQDVKKPDANAVVISPPTHGGMYSMRKKLFETVKGTSYALDQYWDAILKQISNSFSDNGLISRVHIYNDRMKVNDKPIDLRYILGGEYGLEMCDIIDIPKLFKRFKGIRQLALDEECQRCLLYQYGMLDIQDRTEGFMQIFNENPKLQKILVMVGGKSMQITRVSLMSAKNEINQHMQVNSFKEKIDGFSCAHDKNLARKSPGKIKRFSDTMGTKTGSIFSAAYKQLVKENPSIGKALGLGAVGAMAGIVTVGGKIVGAPFAVFDHFKRK